MKKSISKLIRVAGMVAMLSSTGAHSADTSRLETFRSTQIQSYLQGKSQVLSDYQSDSIRLMPAYQQTVLGKANTMAYHQAFLERFTVRNYSRKKYELLDLGSRVIEIGQFTMNVVLKSTGENHELTGKYFDIWEKSAQGELLLNTAAWNYDQQVKIAEDLRFSQVPSLIMAHQARVPVKGGVSFELAALGKLHESTIIQHDGQVWAQFFTDDAIILANHGPLVAGRKAVDEYTAEHAKGLSVFEKLDIRTDRIDDLGNYVIEYATHVANWRAGDYSGVSTGKNIRLWQRGADRSLKVFRSISMYD